VSFSWYGWLLGRGHEKLENMHSEMSESRFRSRISQERRTEGWKREKLKQKTSVKSVVVKIDLGGVRRGRGERGIQGIRQTEEVSGLRMGKGPPDQGAKSGPAQAPPAASARHFHDGPMQAQERRSSELRIIRQTWCLGQRREAVGAEKRSRGGRWLPLSS
jgi:hypothetical protein